MDKAAAEKASVEVLGDVWRDRRVFIPDHEPAPIELVRLDFAVQVVGVGLEYHNTLPLISRPGERREVAGIMDRQSSKIAVAEKYGARKTRFTGAHELGHWVLHSNRVMFRDPPLDGITETPKPQSEREADWFSAAFLVPEKVLRNEIRVRFRTENEIMFDDAVAFWLAGQDADSVLEMNPVGRALAIATAASFAGQHFVSLADFFRVSPSTLAYRLVGLGIVTAR